MQDLLNAFNFLSDHIHLAGWFFLIAFSWKASAKVTKFFSNMEDTSRKTREAADRTLEMDNTLKTLATNHLPHLQQSMDDVNENLKGLRQDILTVVLSRVHHDHD